MCVCEFSPRDSRWRTTFSAWQVANFGFFGWPLAGKGDDSERPKTVYITWLGSLDVFFFFSGIFIHFGCRLIKNSQVQFWMVQWVNYILSECLDIELYLHQISWSCTTSCHRLVYVQVDLLTAGRWLYQLSLLQNLWLIQMEWYESWTKTVVYILSFSIKWVKFLRINGSLIFFFNKAYPQLKISKF